MNLYLWKLFFLMTVFLLLTGCGFHLQGKANLSPALNRIYIKTNDPYGVLARSLHAYLKSSNVQLVNNPIYAKTILAILQDNSFQELISVSGTQQTRQYNLKVVVQFEITDAEGRILVPTQTLEKNQALTIQTDQVLGSSNQVNNYYQKMRRELAGAIIDRIASRQITQLIDTNLAAPKRPAL